MASTICDDGTGLATLSTPTRNRYFYGKLLDVFHLELETDYHSAQRRLLNRLALGSGVLCGLGIEATGDGGISIGTGVAIDPVGREIVVPLPSQRVDPRQPTDACGNPFGDPLKDGAIATICLAFHQCAAEPVPALVCDCGDNACESSSIRERYAVVISEGPPDAVTLACLMPGLFEPNDDKTAFELSYPALVERVSAACPDATIGCVVLGQVAIPDADKPITADMIDLSARRIVYSNQLLFDMLTCLPVAGTPPPDEGEEEQPPPPPVVTELAHVKEISWPHDKSMGVGQFIEGLKVTFDRPVNTAPNTRRAWFLVDLEFPFRQEPVKALPFVQNSIGVVRVLEEEVGLVDPQTAVFRPDPSIQEFLARVKEEVIVRVRVLCDHLVDEKGLAVDGNFLGGALPSGDGTAGGLFESWFQLEG